MQTAADDQDITKLGAPNLEQLRRSAAAIAATVNAELAKLSPAGRREVMMQSIEWLRRGIAILDESARRARQAIVAPSAQETHLFS